MDSSFAIPASCASMGHERGTVKLERGQDGKNLPVNRLERSPPRLPQLHKSPLVPVALSFSAGIVLDHLAVIPLPISLLVAVFGAAAWFLARTSSNPYSSLLWLGLGLAALGSAYHHWRHEKPANDLGRLLAEEQGLVRLRGLVLEEPVHRKGKPGPLTTIPPKDSSRVLLDTTALEQNGDWRRVSGKVQVFVTGNVANVTVGNEVEVFGNISTAAERANPGGWDHVSALEDQGIRALLHVQHPDNLKSRGPKGLPWSLSGILASIRSWARGVLGELLPEGQQRLAQALLLGDRSALDQEEWDVYQRTGVVHVLAISGQHLAVLALFLWLICRVLHISNRPRALVLIVFVIAYALLTGARTPVLRAMFMVCAYCVSVLGRRVVFPPNLLAFAWLMVCLISPMQVFQVGSQLSFLAVTVLIWGIPSQRGFLSGIGGAFNTQPQSPGTDLDRLLAPLLEEQRPLWFKGIRWVGLRILLTYVVAGLVWLAIAPLVAARFHLNCPVALLIGPPVLLLTSLALICGLLTLVVSLVFLPLAWPLALVTRWSLGGCQYLVTRAEAVPFAYWYVTGPAEWWLIGFYLVLFCWLMIPYLRSHSKWMLQLVLAWTALGVLASLIPFRGEGLRCTFLAVGHGSCIVLETSDGRTLLYDAGALTGPEVTRQHIAPFLWSRGIQRIDEVILSHADLDHFNGLPALLERFSVGQVTFTPTFADRKTPGVEETLKKIKQHNISMRPIKSGEVLTSGDLSLRVLHPPATGPPGVENARSMVLLLSHHNHTILLTGDLADEGLSQFLSQRPVPVDILMSPHHGSKTANTADLARHTRPKVVISCQGRARSGVTANVYKKAGANFLTTWEHGAVTVISRDAELVVETFRTGEKWKID
jgi:competence protein ComEC